MRLIMYVIGAYSNDRLVGFLGWRSSYGHRTLRPFSPQAKGFAVWKTEKGAKNAISKTREYNMNHTYTIENWLNKEGYTLKVIEH